MSEKNKLTQWELFPFLMCKFYLINLDMRCYILFKNYLTIMKVAGIPIRLHFSYLLILPFIAVTKPI